MDLGALLKAPTEDPEWVKKMLIMGLCMLVPVAGALNILGYQKACYQMRAAGQKELPPAGLNYIGDGWWMFVAMLPIVGLIFLFQIVNIGIVMLMPRDIGGIISLVFMLLMMVVMLGIGVLSPAIFYRHFVHGDRWASLKIPEMIQLVKNHTSPYLMLWVTVLVAGLIGQVGMFACYIGLFFTLPYAYAVNGMAIADFANETKRA